MNAEIITTGANEVVDYLGVAIFFGALMLISWILSIHYKIDNEKLRKKLKIKNKIKLSKQEFMFE